jgi:hypothetical protein
VAADVSERDRLEGLSWARCHVANRSGGLRHSERLAAGQSRSRRRHAARFLYGPRLLGLGSLASTDETNILDQPQLARDRGADHVGGELLTSGTPRHWTSKNHEAAQRDLLPRSRDY